MKVILPNEEFSLSLLVVYYKNKSEGRISSKDDSRKSKPFALCLLTQQTPKMTIFKLYSYGVQNSGQSDTN